jgi:Ran GTPase-activating protein (RanGAP) involved in mRNA processing and transport
MNLKKAGTCQKKGPRLIDFVVSMGNRPLSPQKTEEERKKVSENSIEIQNTNSNNNNNNNNNNQSCTEIIDCSNEKEVREAINNNKKFNIKSSVTVLDFSQASFGSDGGKYVAEILKSNSTITKLNLSNNSISFDGAKSITDALKLNSTLTSLNISSNIIGDDGAIRFAYVLKSKSALTKLNISTNSIGTKGAKSIADALAKNSTLKSLDLNSNSIGEEGAIYIADFLNLESNSTLTKLNISSNSIGSVGAKSIGDALCSSKSPLINLNISNNIIEAIAAQSFADNVDKNKKIRKINLSYNGLKPDTMKYFALVIYKRKNIDLSLECIFEESAQKFHDIIIEVAEEVDRARKDKILSKNPPIYCIINSNDIPTFNIDNNNPTIVLIGTNGVGKSTFGNWLFNYGLPGIKADDYIEVKEKYYNNTKESKPFITSSDLNFSSTTCCTDKVQLYSFSNKINIIDTPGLNDPNDFENMHILTQFILSLSSLSAIILCLPYSVKFDDPTIETIKYYEKLFRPIFRTKQVIIVFTKVDNEEYLISKQEEEWKGSVGIKLSKLSEKFNYDFDIGFAFNTIYDEELILRENSKNSDTLLGLSMRNRDMIFTLVESFKPINLSEIQLLFALPPALERKKNNILDGSKVVCSNILEVLGGEGSLDRKKILEQLEKYSSEFNEKDKEKRKLQVLLSFNNFYVYSIYSF